MAAILSETSAWAREIVLPSAKTVGADGLESALPSRDPDCEIDCRYQVYPHAALSRLLCARVVARNHVSGSGVAVVGTAFYKRVVQEGRRALQSVGGRRVACDGFTADRTQ